MQGRFRVNRVIEWHIIIVRGSNFQLFPLKHRAAIAKILGLSKNVRQIYELLSLSKSRGYGQKVRGIAKKKNSRYRWLSLIVHCYRYNIQLRRKDLKLTSRSQGYWQNCQYKRKRTEGSCPLYICQRRKAAKPNASGTTWARITAHRSSTMLLHSTEFARNYHVALSLLWVAGDESNLKWMQCFSLSNNHLKKSIFTLTFLLSQRSLHFYFSQFFPSWRIQGMPYEIFSTYPCEIPPWNSMEIYGNPWNSTELPWNAMEFHGMPWSSTEFHEVVMEFHGMPWNSMEYRGVPWNAMGFPEVPMQFHGMP